MFSFESKSTRASTSLLGVKFLVKTEPKRSRRFIGNTRQTRSILGLSFRRLIIRIIVTLWFFEKVGAKHLPNYKVCTFTPVTANASPLHGAADIFIVGIFQKAKVLLIINIIQLFIFMNRVYG